MCSATSAWPRGDSLYDAGVQGGRLLRTIFLCDYFVNPVFRRELLRVLNRGEATNTLKRAIYIGRVAAYHVPSALIGRIAPTHIEGLNLDASLYTLLQIFSLTLFEKIPIQQCFPGSSHKSDEGNPCNQLNLL